MTQRSASALRAEFEAVSETVLGALQPGEDATLSWAAEQSLFCRFSGGAVRQAGSVDQAELTLRLISGGRHARATVDVAGPDAPAVALRSLRQLRSLLPALPADPYLLWNEAGDRLPSRDDPGPESTSPSSGRADDAMGRIVAAARDLGGAQPLDLVGILADGRIARGFSSSRGGHAWQSVPRCHLDFSLYLQGDKAVKSAIAGPDAALLDLEGAIAAAAGKLRLLALPAIDLPRGRYRAWLEPAAVAELLALLSWGGFSGSELHTRSSPLLRLQAGEVALNPSVHLVEDLESSAAPRISGDGFVRPPQVPLVAAGRFAGALVSPRSAIEHGLQQNGANDEEGPEALTMAPGTLSPEAALQAVGDGVYVSNLWYLNWSDRAAACATGMTRFATFAVRDGVIAGPMQVMRFDDSLFRLLGEGLLALGDRAETLPDASTYGRRSTQSVRTPGALVEGLAFTL